MPNFEIYDGETLVNVIVADSKEIAEQVTGMIATEVIPIIPIEQETVGSANDQENE